MTVPLSGISVFSWAGIRLTCTHSQNYASKQKAELKLALSSRGNGAVQEDFNLAESTNCKNKGNVSPHGTKPSDIHKVVSSVQGGAFEN